MFTTRCSLMTAPRLASPPASPRRLALVLVLMLTASLALPWAQEAAEAAGVPAPAGRPQLELQIGHTGAVWAVAFAPDGRTLISAGDEGSRRWDTATGALEWTRTATFVGQRGLSLSADGRLLAGTGGRGLALWETGTSAPARAISAPGAITLSVAFSPDGKMLASGSRNGAVELRDVATGAVLYTLPATGAPAVLAFAPDGKMLGRRLAGQAEAV
jgi:WD40 repeat protein